MKSGFAAALFFAALAPFWAPMSGQAQTAPKTPEATPNIIVPQSTTTTNYDAKQGFPDHSGPFSAMLVVIPKAQLAEFNKPAGASRQLSRVARAEPGANLAVKIMFTGPLGDSNGVGKVTADVQILDPSGNIYAASNYKELPVWVGQVGKGQGVFDNRETVPVITFEPKDVPGVYTIKAVVHDRFAQRDIPLETRVELLPAHVAGGDAPPVAAAAPAPEAVPATDTPPAQNAARAKAHKKRRHH